MSVPRPEAMTSATAVLAAATGDEQAFAALVAAHHASMARVAFVICGDEDTTRDVVQAAWTIAWGRLPSLRDPAQVRAWLVAIAANEARQALRRRRRQPIVDISPEVARDAQVETTPGVELVDLRRVLSELSFDERRLLAMRYAAGLASPEIARQLGISPSGVRSRLARLIERLREDLALERGDPVP